MAEYEKMDVKKDEYHAVSGTSYPEEHHMAASVISEQPTSVSGIESYVLDLDAAQVASKSQCQVIFYRLDQI